MPSFSCKDLLETNLYQPYNAVLFSALSMQKLEWHYMFKCVFLIKVTQAWE